LYRRIGDHRNQYEANIMQLFRRHPAFALSLFVALTFVGIACSRPNLPVAHEPPPERAPATAAFGSTQILRVGKSVTFDDGLSITLKAVNDSRCPAKVQCVWAGELAPELVVHGGALADNGQTFSLGTVTAKEHALDGYVVALADASSSTATLIVSKTGDGETNTGAGDSGVRGMVTIGPTCPVERMPPDPNCADRPQSANFAIDSPAGAQVATVASSTDGSFSIALPAGTYVIHLQGPAAMPSMSPQEFTVPAHGFVEVRLSLDSGVR
jgi:hypothetical protein